MPNLKKLKFQEDRLWGDHYWQTRELIKSAVDRSPCLSVDTDALLAIVKLQGDNFGRLTGNYKAGEKLGKELIYHIEIAIEIVTLAIQKKSIDEAYKRWMENGRKIAYVYHRYHHSIEFDEMNYHMQIHLKTTLAEAVAIIGKDCFQSQEKGQIALDHIRGMSNYILSKF